MAKKKTAGKKALGSDSGRELERETSKILRLKDHISKNFWDLGSSLLRVSDKKLFRSAGFLSFEEYLMKEVKIGRSTAYRLMELARNFSRETANVFGQEKLLGAIAYAKATPEEDRPIDVTAYEIEVKTPAGNKIKKSFEKASSKEIKRAAALLRRRLKSKEPTAELPLPSLAGLLSGKKPKLEIAAFLKNAKEKLKAISPRPAFSLTVSKKGKDPLVDLRLSNVRASRLVEALSYVMSAAMEVWLGSVR